MNTKNSRITAGVGTARYVVATNEPPAFLIDAIPGARRAYDRWQEANEAGRKLVAELSSAQRAVPATRWIGEGDDARRVPSGDTTQAELDEALLAVRDAERAASAHSKRALAALAAFDAHFVDQPRPDSARRAAAAHALAKHREAEAAWKTLQAALDERDAAYGHAGSPAPLQARDEGGRRTAAALPTSFEFGAAARVVGERVDLFAAAPLAALTEIVEGA